jgi:hypothetical protein
MEFLVRAWICPIASLIRQVANQWSSMLEYRRRGREHAWWRGEKRLLVVMSMAWGWV